MNIPTVSVRWSAPIPMSGADASPIPGRGGVYELLVHDEDGVDRMFVGSSEDLRRAFVSHSGGSKGDAELRRAVMANPPFFRYWECEVTSRRGEVLAALADLHVYEFGHDDPENAGCVRLVETY